MTPSATPGGGLIKVIGYTKIYDLRDRKSELTPDGPQGEGFHRKGRASGCGLLVPCTL